MSVLEQERDYDPMQVFTYALKASESQRQYPTRFKPFLDFLRLEGSLEQQAKEFWLKASENIRWAEDSLIQFIRFQTERAASGQISPSTIPNYYRRIKPILYTMASSGIRIGAFDYLNWKHIIPVQGINGEILAAKIIVYAGDNEEYYSFITPEAYQSLSDWMDFRA
jgi:hypothetical protein